MADSDIAGLDKFARAIRKSPDAADKAFGIAVDAGAEEALKLGRAMIGRQLNLDKSYIEKNLTITQRSKSQDPVAKIGGRRRATQLTRYGGNRVATTKAKSPSRKLRGDKRRGIAPGQKAAGIKAFSVKNGSTPKKWPGGFIIFLKNGNVGLATRTGKARDDYKVHYGPSVGDAWRTTRNEVAPAAMREVERVFEKEFKRLK